MVWLSNKNVCPFLFILLRYFTHAQVIGHELVVDFVSKLNSPLAQQDSQLRLSGYYLLDMFIHGKTATDVIL